MHYVNPPAQAPDGFFHRTFYSERYGHELGYNIYLPPDYEAGRRRYPVAYHLHGWTGDESSEIGLMEGICRSRQAIAVFPNNSPVIEDLEDLPVEAMMVHELIPHIDGAYRTEAARESRSISGFSMGGGLAFYFAVKYPGLFSSVVAYAGTYHHYFHRDYPTVGVAPERAGEIYRAMTSEGKVADRDLLLLLNRNADKIRNELRITLHIGTADVLYCDNEILHLHLDSLRIPHEYRRFPGASHALGEIL